MSLNLLGCFPHAPSDTLSSPTSMLRACRASRQHSLLHRIGSCRKSVRLASTAVDGIAFVQRDLQAAGRQAIIDAFVDVEVLVAVARGSGELQTSEAKR